MRSGRLFIALLALVLTGTTDAGRIEAQVLGTRRILAIRVSFPQEVPDEETTSGDGTFDLRSLEDALPDYRFPFDTPPHDRSYFSAHLRALAHYYDTVSDGRLSLEYDVFPRADRESYELEQELIDYGNGRTRTEINTRIVDLFRDGVLAADAAEGDDLDFSDYDDVIVIHAGLGGESSNQLNDVPSAFIDRTDLDTFADGPIPVDGGAATIERGILLPEAGGDDGRSGLNGILARFYANQLGLPRLDNPEDGLPAVGDWSLMDTGNITVASANRLGFDNLTGAASDTILIAYSPSRLTAWSRARLGWLAPVVVRHDTTISIAAPHVDGNLPEAVRIPVTADEYFLLENRMSRLDVEGRRPDITLSNGGSGVWIANDDYDAFIPGSGIMIWHVDDAVVDASVGGKAVNSNPDFRLHFDGLVGLYRKGVAVEEADGLEDIGNTSASRVVTSGIISFASISGGPRDPYYVGNVTRFAPDTTPASDNNLGYATGVEIEVLSAPGDVMDVAIRFNRQEDGWPREVASVVPAVAPRSARVDGAVLLLSGADDGVAWTLDGAPADLVDYDPALTPAIGRVLQSDTDELLFSDDGSPAVFSAGRVVSIADTGGPAAAPVSTPPLVGKFPGGTNNDIWGGADGTVSWGIFGPDAGAATVGADAVVGMAIGDVAPAPGNELVALDAAGRLTVVESSGVTTTLATLEDPVGGPVVGDLDGSGTDEIVVVSRTGSVTIFHEGTDPRVGRSVAGGAASGPVLADTDRDGFAEILFGGEDRVWITRYNAVAQSGTPFEIPMRDRAGRIEAPPVVADLDDDGELDIVAASGTGIIYAFSGSGTPIPGFPLLAAGGITTSPLLDDLDGDGRLELVAYTRDGTAHLWHLDRIDPALTGTTVAWGQQGGERGNTSSLSATDLPVEPPAFPDLIPEARAYCYPNPIRGTEATIRYFLTADADVRLTVVNAAGRIVDRIRAARVDVGTDNEIRWDTTGYGSGLYVCRLEATGGGRTETRFIKAAVIR